MKELSLQDKCYKFFWEEPLAKSGPESIKYAAHTRYTGGKFFYFRKDEALKSLKDFIYFMKYGDKLAEIIVDENVQKNSLEASPNHFSTTNLSVGNVYKFNTVEMVKLVKEVLDNCIDFSEDMFFCLVGMMVERKAFDVALCIYQETKTKSLLTEGSVYERQTIELTNARLKSPLTLDETKKCSNIEEYINCARQKLE